MRNPLASRFDERADLVMKSHQGFGTLGTFPRERSTRTYFPPTLLRISVTFPTPFGFLPRLALLLVTSFFNFLTYVHELTGLCVKFGETVPGKRESSPERRKKHRCDRRDGAPAGSSLFSRSDMIYSEDGRDVHLVGNSQSRTCNQVHGLESPASRYHHRRILIKDVFWYALI